MSTRSGSASEIDKIVRKIMTDNDLKAVIAGVSVAGQPVLTKAWGEFDDRRAGHL